MDLSRDSLYYLIKEEQIPHYNKINCFYFSDCYFQELLSLLGNKKLMSLVFGKIMTHTYFRFLTGSIGESYFDLLTSSRFNIRIGRTNFKRIRQKHSL